MKKTVLITSIFLFLFAKKVVEIEKIKLSSITQTVRLKGTVCSQKAAQICAKKSGVLGAILIPSGFVKKGDKIAHLENETLSKIFTLEQQQAERIEKLRGKKTISPREYEIEYKEFLTAKAQLENTEFVAPFDGMLGVFQFSEGNCIKEGEPLVAIYEQDSLFVRLNLPEHLSASLHTGQSVLIEGKSYPNLSIQKMLDEKTHMLPAKIDTPQLEKLIGCTVDVDIITGQKDKALTIPASAVFMRNNKNYVYIMQKKKACMKEVTLGIRAKDRIEITKGINENDAVIIRGLGRLYDGIDLKLS